MATTTPRLSLMAQRLPLLIDAEGLVLKANVHSAKLLDQEGIKGLFPRLTHLCLDAGYGREDKDGDWAEKTPSWTAEISGSRASDRSRGRHEVRPRPHVPLHRSSVPRGGIRSLPHRGPCLSLPLLSPHGSRVGRLTARTLGALGVRLPHRAGAPPHARWLEPPHEPAARTSCSPRSRSFSSSAFSSSATCYPIADPRSTCGSSSAVA